MKRIPLLAVLLLVLGLLAGCGGGASSAADDGGSAGGPPTDASVEDFCGAFLDLVQQVNQAGDDITDEQALKLAKDLAEKLTEVGTPADMPEAARRAFVTALEKIKSIPDGATREEMNQVTGELTEEEQKDQEALGSYITEKCMGQLPGGGSDSGSASSSPSQ